MLPSDQGNNLHSNKRGAENEKHSKKMVVSCVHALGCDDVVQKKHRGTLSELHKNQGRLIGDKQNSITIYYRLRLHTFYNVTIKCVILIYIIHSPHNVLESPEQLVLRLKTKNRAQSSLMVMFNGTWMCNMLAEKSLQRN